MAAQDCNLAMYNAAYLTNGMQPSSAVYASGTSGAGAFPCTLTVQGASANGGSITITDANGKQVWTTLGLALPNQSTVAAGQALAQGTRLYSPNGQYFIILQNDGNLVICGDLSLQRPVSFAQLPL